MTKSDEELVEQAGSEFMEKLRGKIDEYRALDDNEELNLDKIETMWSLSRKASDEVLRNVYTTLVNGQGERKLIKKKRAELKALGIEVRNKGKQTRCIATVNGPLEIRRTVLCVKVECREALGKSFEIGEIIPLDDYLCITELPMKMSRQMMAAAAFWGQHESSYKSAEYIVQNYYGVELTDSTIREATNRVGKVVFDEDCRKAENIAKNGLKVPDSADREGILYGFVDGAAINTRDKDAAGSSWRENKLGEFYSSDHMRKRKGGKGYDVLEREYCDYLGSVEEFEKHFFECAVKNGYGHYKTMVIISDGAPWIRKMCDELFPDAVQILDLFHLEENIYSFGKQLFNDDASLYAPWAEGIIALIKESRTEEALLRLKPYKDRRFAVGVVNPYTYLLNNKDRVNYALYREKGYIVGSGSIESGNKTVLQKRCKLAWMRWNVPTAQYVLSLRAKEESGLWGSTVRPLLLAA